MKDQLRKIVREILREKAISELELSKAEMDKLHSDGEVDVDGEKVTYDESVVSEDDTPCWDTHKVGNPKTKISSKTGKRVNNCVPKNESVSEGTLNESPSSEELKIVMMAVRKIAKYRNVPIDQSINDVLNAAEQLERDIKKGKIKK